MSYLKFFLFTEAVHIVLWSCVFQVLVKPSNWVMTCEKLQNAWKWRNFFVFGKWLGHCASGGSGLSVVLIMISSSCIISYLSQEMTTSSPNNQKVSLTWAHVWSRWSAWLCRERRTPGWTACGTSSSHSTGWWGRHGGRTCWGRRRGWGSAWSWCSPATGRPPTACLALCSL